MSGCSDIKKTKQTVIPLMWLRLLRAASNENIYAGVMGGEIAPSGVHSGEASVCRGGVPDQYPPLSLQVHLRMRGLDVRPAHPLDQVRGAGTAQPFTMSFTSWLQV